MEKRDAKYTHNTRLCWRSCLVNVKASILQLGSKTDKWSKTFFSSHTKFSWRHHYWFGVRTRWHLHVHPSVLWVIQLSIFWYKNLRNVNNINLLFWYKSVDLSEGQDKKITLRQRKSQRFMAFTFFAWNELV